MSLELFDLSGRTAVVMGGTSGIGRILAVGLAQAGANVVATGRRENLVDEVAGEIEKLGRKTLRMAADARKRESIDDLRDAVVKATGRVDILLNAAGQIFRKPTIATTEAEWTNLVDINLTGTLRACQSFYEPLLASGQGRVINIASLNSYVSLFEVAAYAASKSGVLGLTRSLAVEWAQKGINVNAIAPGVFVQNLIPVCWMALTVRGTADANADEALWEYPWSLLGRPCSLRLTRRVLSPGNRSWWTEDSWRRG